MAAAGSSFRRASRRFGDLRAPNPLASGQRSQKFAGCFAECGMARLGSDLDQRFQNKPPLMHGGMGDLQVRLIHDAVGEEHHVDINLARAFIAHAKASHGRFHLQGKLEQFSRRFLRFYRHHAVQKPGLVGNVHWLGFIPCGNRQQPARHFQLFDRLAQVGCAISQVRSQRQISGFRHGVSFAGNGARSQRKLTATASILILWLSKGDSPGLQPTITTDDGSQRCDFPL